VYAYSLSPGNDFEHSWYFFLDEKLGLAQRKEWKMKSSIFSVFCKVTSPFTVAVLAIFSGAIWEQVSFGNDARLVRIASTSVAPNAYRVYLPLISANSSTSNPAFTIEQTLSDGGQRNTIAFDALAFLTGNLGADSFFPPGKVADFWGFQYLRDNDPSGMGHNTDFLTRAALNMLQALTPTQRDELIALAESQVADINQYAYDRFVLMDAFRRLVGGDLPSGSTGLDQAAVLTYSAQLYHLDGEISYQRALVMGGLLSELDTTQRAYLDAMVGKGRGGRTRRIARAGTGYQSGGDDLCRGYVQLVCRLHRGRCLLLPGTAGHLFWFLLHERCTRCGQP
jgi:hypothetical protein